MLKGVVASFRKIFRRKVLLIFREGKFVVQFVPLLLPLRILLLPQLLLLIVLLPLRPPLRIMLLPLRLLQLLTTAAARTSLMVG